MSDGGLLGVCSWELLHCHRSERAVVQHVPVVKQVEILEYHPDLLPECVQVHPQIHQILSVKPDGTGVDLPTLIPGTVPVNRGNYNFVPGILQNEDDESLYIDNPIFQLHRNNMRDAADKLILDTSAFGYENEVCGTDSMLLLADYYHQVAETTGNYREMMINPFDTTIGKMGQSITDVDEKCSEILTVNTED